MTKFYDLRDMTAAMSENMKAYTDTGTKPWDARIALRDLSYQAGGILKLDMQLHNERHKQGKTEQELRDDLEMELAEVISLALFAADELDLDVEKGFRRMLKIDDEKISERSKE